MAHYNVRMARYSSIERSFGFDTIERLTKAQAEATFEALVLASEKNSPYLYVSVFRIDRNATEDGKRIKMVRFAKDVYKGTEQGFRFEEEPVDTAA